MQATKKTPANFTCMIPLNDRRREDFNKFCEVVLNERAKREKERGPEAAEAYLDMIWNVVVFYSKRSEDLTKAAKRVAINYARGISPADSLPTVLDEVMKEHASYFKGMREGTLKRSYARKSVEKSLTRFISLVMNQLPEDGPKVIINRVASGAA